MIIAQARTARGDLVLSARSEAVADDEVLELRVNGLFVMDTHQTSTETALAAAALSRHPDPRRVLVGGLGLGFTLAEVLSDERVEAVLVAEVEDALVDWMRSGLIPHGPALLADPRARIAVGDVSEVVASSADDGWDLVLLDVDNGPDNLVLSGNAALYEPAFLRDVRRVLARDGLVVVWSATESEALLGAMSTVFAEVEAVAFAVDLQGRNERYWLHLAR